jgi:hypothetical protein
LAPCGSGSGTNYRSQFAYPLNGVYALQPVGPGNPTRACYVITSITAPQNTQELPTLYGPLTGCGDSNCQQQ